MDGKQSQQYRQHFTLSESSKQMLEALTTQRYPGRQRRQSQLVEDLITEAFMKEQSMNSAATGIRGTTRLSWLRQAPGVASPKSIKRFIERLTFLRDLSLPALPATLHQNRVLQLARKCSKYHAQPLLNLPRERRHALLVAYLAQCYGSCYEVQGSGQESRADVFRGERMQICAFCNLHRLLKSREIYRPCFLAPSKHC
ncbi:MAG: hypothetical protein J2P37_31525 [Ktedonobacteraceae bacterium]|nr:hypothetical protein [Ktedonobacteraceae bacterium]